MAFNHRKPLLVVVVAAALLAVLDSPSFSLAWTAQAAARCCGRQSHKPAVAAAATAAASTSTSASSPWRLFSSSQDGNGIDLGETLSNNDLPQILPTTARTATAITTSAATGTRRDALAAAMAAASISSFFMLPIDDADASGGATAGRYTTIPIAKRRYYGRVQEGVHEFLLMGPDVVKGDMTAGPVQHFFDPLGALIVPARRQDIGGQCTKKDGNCQGKEIRDSRYNDMKASMYLLANAFRTDQQKPPDRLPTVKAARAFFKEMDEMEKLIRKKKTNDPAAVAQYAKSLDILDRYLDLVELPPTDSGHYDEEFDTLVGETARIT